MGAYEKRQDARARGDHAKAFRLTMDILRRKGSKRLIYREAEEAVKCLEALGEAWRLHPRFWELSCYGQREDLERVARELQHAGII